MSISGYLQMIIVAAITFFYNNVMAEDNIRYDTELLKAYQNKGADYKPRTEHLAEDGKPKYINKLIFEDSAYLLQHAHNPVNWHPWSEAAFALAKTSNKPIFLSVGYSTCHWCHVMEKESFENEKIAEYLNRHFISIKVDREQHPQVDNYYMSALNYIKNSGGWPMSVFILPDGKAFHADTYLPPENFLHVLKGMVKLWDEDPNKVKSFAHSLANRLQAQHNVQLQAESIDHNLINTAVSLAINNSDELQGGFGEAPKFPKENLLLFLLEQYQRQADENLGETLWITLDAMAHGGIYDQVGGGFHRYAIDNAWLVPHFEKMLYNQAMLARVYLKAWAISNKPLYRQVAEKTLDFVLRDLTDNSGAFHAATDADSGKGEGEYFIWSIEELTKILSPDAAKLTIDFYGLSESGNFEGKNILYISESHHEFAKRHNLSLTAWFGKLDAIHKIMLATRNQRPLPFKDKKIISAWNGLMLNALAEAYQLLGADKYLKAAEKAADYIWQSFKDNELPRIINFSTKTSGILDDYVYFAEGMLALYDAGFENKWLERTEQLINSIEIRFKDPAGGYFMNQNKVGSPKLPRVKDIQDGAIYSATAALYRILHRLYTRTGDEKLRLKRDELLNTSSGIIKFAPEQNAYFLAQVADTIFGETGKTLFTARGNVRIKAGEDKKGKFISLDFKKNWHINSDKPLDEKLIPTSLSAINGRLGRVEYPEPQITKLGFSKTRLSLFNKKSKIYYVTENRKLPQKLKLKLQACDDKNCLPPESLIIYL